MKPTVKLVVALLSIYAAFWHFGPRSIYAKSYAPWFVVPLIQQQKLTASDTAAGDQFGRVVALNGDTAIVGAFAEDNTKGNEAGAAYVFVRNGGVWTQQQKLMASDGAPNDNFGFSVAIDGDTALVGAIRANTSTGVDAGAVYVFTRIAGVWTQQQRFQASDGALNDAFGGALDLDGDIAVVGSDGDDDGGNLAGSSYVFTKSGGIWTQQQKLTASDPSAGDNFGDTVAVDGTTIIVGAKNDDHPGKTDAGSVYVFTRNGNTWIQQQRLTASDAAVSDDFGFFIDLSGDTAIVGADGNDGNGNNAGAAYIFSRNNGVWTQQQRLHASDAGDSDGFGAGVCIEGDTAVVAAFAANTSSAPDSGAAYVFTRSGNVWIQQQKIFASDGATNDHLGLALAMSGSTVIIGAPDDDHPGATDAGSAYVFVSAIPNNPPTVDAGPDQSATEEVAFNLVASFTDPDVTDTHTASVNWGDGSPAQAATVTEPSGSNPGLLNASHTYLAPGTYQVTVTVTDAANATASDTLQVTVVEPVSGNYIHNTTTSQANANFNISGNGVIGGNLTVNGTLNANGSSLTDLNAANITTGTIDNARLGLIPSANIADGAVVRSLNGLTDHVNLAAGSNVTITPSGNTLTISTAGGGNFIANSTTQQPGSHFNISGDGVAANLTAAGTVTGNILNATTQFNLGGNRILSSPGTDNTFAGRNAGTANSTGAQNSFFGSSSGTANTEGYFNAFFGSFAGHSNTTGYGNSFFGDRAGMNNTSAYGNSFFGVLAGGNNTAIGSSFFGFQAGLNNTVGYSNVFLGYNAGYANTAGSGNLFAGTYAGLSNTTGDRNLFAGHDAGRNTTSGYNNSFIGAFSGPTNTTGIANTLIGAFANVSSNDLFFATAIGSEATVSTSNTIALGRANGADKVRIFGLGSAGSIHLCRNASNEISTCSSSLRYKTNILPFSLGLNLVQRLRPITFAWKADGARDLGFGAEEVAAINPLLVTYNANGEVEGVKYDRISALLVNAIKEQQAQIEAQQKELKQQQMLINNLSNLICQLKPNASICQ